MVHRLLPFCLGLLAASLVSASAPAAPLVLTRALPVEGPAGLEPSGLTVCDGRLLMVSDDHADRVFLLALAADRARARVYRTVEAPTPDLSAYAGLPWLQGRVARYDWEGLACDEADNLYLLSEALAQVLKLPPRGRGRWLGDAVYRAGRQIGLFEQHNAFAEGLALTPTRAYVAAERQPRGLVVADRSSEPWTAARAVWLNPFPDLARPHDFSGLWAEGEALYTLERNHFQVCRRDPETFAVRRCWSYRAVEEGAAYRYAERRFGRAEGIARRGDLLYLVLDNNGDAREADPADHRPWLFEFALPADW